MSRQIEMHWHCATCSTRNRGRELNCTNCLKPRENEKYEMPEDTARAPSVTDPDLLKKATAGPNWHCRYCRSSQRRPDGNCRRCGAPSAEGTTEADEPEEPSAPKVSQAPLVRKTAWLRTMLIVLGVLCVGSTAWWALAPHEKHVVVTAVSWEHSVAIQRYQVVGEAGWYAAGDGFDVHNEGPRVHHYDHRAVGSHLESYTEQVPDGETCRPRPKSCREKCTSNKNGFASCNEVCTGGGESCSPKYKTVKRSRRVTDYQDFPIYQGWYSWRAWRWKFNRDVVLSGHSTETRWPTAEDERLNVGLSGKEEEREGAKNASYVVTYTRDGKSWNVHPSNEAEFRKRKVGSSWRIDVNQLGLVSNEIPE